MDNIIIQKGKTVELPVSLGFDVSKDTIVSDLRVDSDPESDLIASWVVSFETNGEDGQLLLTMDQSVTTDISQSAGYMFLDRTSGVPVAILVDPLPVVFNEVT